MQPPSALDELILCLLTERAGKSLDPTEVARRVLPDDAAWHRLMPQVRATAVGLARAGKITILRKGKPVDPDDFKGVYRLALPAQGAGSSSDDLPVSQ